MKDNKIRLQKYMSENGIASRRKSEELIEAGKVKVNGRVASLGDKVDPIRDKIVVSGKRVVRTKTKMYIMLHKRIYCNATKFMWSSFYKINIWKNVC